MYKNSTDQIKLFAFVSEKFGNSKGTEQGHPLSQDLFKIYILPETPLSINFFWKTNRIIYNKKIYNNVYRQDYNH